MRCELSARQKPRSRQTQERRSRELRLLSIARRLTRTERASRSSLVTTRTSRRPGRGRGRGRRVPVMPWLTWVRSGSTSTLAATPANAGWRTGVDIAAATPTRSGSMARTGRSATQASTPLPGNDPSCERPPVVRGLWTTLPAQLGTRSARSTTGVDQSTANGSSDRFACISATSKNRPTTANSVAGGPNRRSRTLKRNTAATTKSPIKTILRKLLFIKTYR